MLFSVFYAIPPSVTTCNLSEKELYKKMAYLAEFWLILEGDIIEHALHKIFLESI
jgi:hypothetical protein